MADDDEDQMNPINFEYDEISDDEDNQIETRIRRLREILIEDQFTN
jgi:hypothetical protein